VDVTPRISTRNLRSVARWEHAARFVIGGGVTVLAGLIIERFGVAFGGMFLAFPAILPASLTLMKRQDGRRMAADDARGNRIGAIALAGFAAMVTTTAKIWPLPATLAVASVTWLAIAYALWSFTLARRPPRRP
jgi:hypothetical protein